jgi:hypothetical protein
MRTSKSETSKSDFAVVQTDDMKVAPTTSGYVPIVGTPTDPELAAPGDGSSMTEYTVSAIQLPGSASTGSRRPTTGYSISVDTITQEYLDPLSGKWIPIGDTTGLPFALNVTAGGSATTVTDDQQFVVQVTNLPNYPTYDARVVVEYTLASGGVSSKVQVTVTRPKF